jgi:putative FmdB family regulatory protein
MPIYEYECEKCGTHAEVLQKFSDPPVTECDSCHGKMKKLISQSTFHLKGTGWYVTDYASKSSASSEPSCSKEKPGGASNSAEKKKMEAKSSTENSAKSDPPKKKD